MLKRLFGIIEDARTIVKRDPACKSLLEVIFLYPGFQAVLMHRVARVFYRIKLFFVARLISQINRFITGIEIHPGARIGRGLFIDHGIGVVIGETSEIGDFCTIYHGVTLGGTGKEKGKRHPTIGNNVLISAGAKILGAIKVGDNARIGANAVVLRDVEGNTTVVGVPGKAVKKGNKELPPSFELDQVGIPDPVAQEMCKFMARLEILEKKLLDTKEGEHSKKIANSGYGIFGDDPVCHTVINSIQINITEEK